MLTEKQGKVKSLGNIRLFGKVQVLIIAALFVALSIVFGKYLSFTAGPFRISFENLTILMAGIFFGPAIGVTVGIVADVIGCIMVGYAINPVITLGAACIGLVSGIMSHYVMKTKNRTLNLAVSIGSAHVIGSMIVKSIGMYIYFGYPVQTLILRVPLYLVIGTAEFYIIYLLLKNKSFSEQIERMCK